MSSEQQLPDAMDIHGTLPLWVSIDHVVINLHCKYKTSAVVSKKKPSIKTCNNGYRHSYDPTDLYAWFRVAFHCQLPKSLTWLDSIRTLPGVERVPSFETRPYYKCISHTLNVWSRVYSPTSIWVGYGVHVGILYVYVHIYHTVQETIFKFSKLHILRYDGEIHSDDLPKALLHSGFEDSIVDSCNRLETSPRRGPRMI